MKISFKIIILLIFIWPFNLQKLQAQEEIKIGLDSDANNDNKNDAFSEKMFLCQAQVFLVKFQKIPT